VGTSRKRGGGGRKKLDQTGVGRKKKKNRVGRLSYGGAKKKKTVSLNSRRKAKGGEYKKMGKITMQKSKGREYRCTRLTNCRLAGGGGNIQWRRGRVKKRYQ